MKFDLFKMLYDEALEETTSEYYIAERGWEDWMDDYDAQEVAEILTSIYTLANSPLKDSRRTSRAEFARTYGIPLRSVENWEAEDRTPPSYVKLLLDFAQFNN